MLMHFIAAKMQIFHSLRMHLTGDYVNFIDTISSLLMVH